MSRDEKSNPEYEKKLAAAVILEIVRQSPGDELVGKTKLFKAFYYAHLYFNNRTGGFLTDWPIVKMPHGPGIDEFKSLLTVLTSAGAMKVEPVTVGPYRSQKFRAVKSSDCLNVNLDEGRVTAVREAVEFTQGKDATELSEITHEHSQSWNRTEDGQELNIYLDSLDDEGVEQAISRGREADECLARIWGR